LPGSQFLNPLKPGITETVDRHGTTLFRKMFWQKRFYRRSCADQQFCY
jgi:hypothetical protein